MTPKEKAERLVEKFYSEVPADDYELGISYAMAQKCALIAIHELINSHLCLTTTHEEPSIRCKRYWQQVKQEIEKL